MLTPPTLYSQTSQHKTGLHSNMRFKITCGTELASSLQADNMAFDVKNKNTISTPHISPKPVPQPPLNSHRNLSFPHSATCSELMLQVN